MRDADELAAAVRQPELGEMVVQTLAGGREHTTDVLADRDGRCVCVVPRQRIEVRSGEVSKSVTMRSSRLQDLAARICAALPGAFGTITDGIYGSISPATIAGGCSRTGSNRGSTSRGSSSPMPTLPSRRYACSNQIEIYFSIVQRKVLSPNDIPDIDAVSDRLSAFEHRYIQTAQPFKWKFTTTTDLTELLARLDNHITDAKHDPAQPRAA